MNASPRRLVAALVLLLLPFIGVALPVASATAAGTVTLSIEEFALAGPAVEDVDVTVHNDSSATLRQAEVTFRGPLGWQVEPGAQSVRTIRPGQSAVVTFQVRIPEPTPGFRIRTFTASATYAGGDGAGTATATRSLRTGDPLADLSAAYNNVGITSESNPTPGNYDGDGNSFSAEKLADVGAGRGAVIEALGATLTMPDVDPGTPDNVASGGQAIELDGQGQRLVFLGSGVGFGATGTATVYYTDGSTSSGSFGFPNWSFQEPDAHGATLVVSSTGRNRPDGYGDSAYQYRLFAHSIPLTGGKTVDFVVLPGNSALHVFDLAVAP
ncbi:NEW3 domain-containing protein [Nocardioides sp.]|uniref:NEW3 domain-containing protein n=1 Tax=Nocardioides sp. TaxID=35761 RepID=UPI002ED0FC39